SGQIEGPPRRAAFTNRIRLWGLAATDRVGRDEGGAVEGVDGATVGTSVQGHKNLELGAISSNVARCNEAGSGSEAVVIHDVRAISGNRERALRRSGTTRSVQCGSYVCRGEGNAFGEDSVADGVDLAAVGLCGADLCLFAGGQQVRDENRGEDADDRDHDQQLDEGEPTLTVGAHVRLLVGRPDK